MYCATMLCLQLMYVSIVSNPASAIALSASAEVYSRFQYSRRRRSCPVSLRDTCSWKPPRIRPMQGVNTHVSTPKSSTEWMTDLKKNTDNRSLTSSLLRILVILLHTARVFVIFRTTYIQSSSTADIILPSYMKEVTISRGRP